MKKISVLVVDGDGAAAHEVAKTLAAEGLDVCCEHAGEAVGPKLLRNPPDLVVLNTELPDTSGFHVCKSIRASFDGGILFLSHSREDMDQLLAFELGADDFISRPVHPRVLCARVKSLARRCCGQARNGSARAFQMGGLRVSRVNREVRLRDRPIGLTTLEFDLLWFLVTHAGQVVGRDRVHRELYNSEYNGADRSVDVTISRLRQKLGDDPASPVFLKTVRGVGYLFAGEAPV